MLSTGKGRFLSTILIFRWKSDELFALKKFNSNPLIISIGLIDLVDVSCVQYTVHDMYKALVHATFTVILHYNDYSHKKKFHYKIACKKYTAISIWYIYFF